MSGLEERGFRQAAASPFSITSAGSLSSCAGFISSTALGSASLGRERIKASPKVRSTEESTSSCSSSLADSEKLMVVMLATMKKEKGRSGYNTSRALNFFPSENYENILT